MKPSSAPARPAQLRKTPARWRRLADASGQPSLPPAFTDSAARSSGLILPHVTRPNSAAESPRSPSVTLPCASSSRSHKYRSPHRYVILCPLCCHRDLATKTNSPPPLQLSFAASPSRRICCCPSRQGRPGAAIADVRRHRAASAIKTILVSPLSPPPSTHVFPQPYEVPRPFTVFRW